MIQPAGGPATGSVSGLLGARGDAHRGASNDPHLNERLAQGTWKSGGQVPGYTGHVSAVNPQVSSGPGRSLDKSEQLFVNNYASVYNGHKIHKLVPEF